MNHVQYWLIIPSRLFINLQPYCLLIQMLMIKFKWKPKKKKRWIALNIVFICMSTPSFKKRRWVIHKTKPDCIKKLELYKTNNPLPPFSFRGFASFIFVCVTIKAFLLIQHLFEPQPKCQNDSMLYVWLSAWIYSFSDVFFFLCCKIVIILQGQKNSAVDFPFYCVLL